MCLTFYESNHLCLGGAFICPPLPPCYFWVWVVMLWCTLYNSVSHVGDRCVEVWSVRSGTPHLIWKLPLSRGDLTRKMSSTLQLKGKSRVLSYVPEWFAWEAVGNNCVSGASESLEIFLTKSWSKVAQQKLRRNICISELLVIVYQSEELNKIL